MVFLKKFIVFVWLIFEEAKDAASSKWEPFFSSSLAISRIVGFMNWLTSLT
jgi:hypothetical protein